MKINELRKLIREEVKGAIQEELKDILLEAIKSQKYPSSNINENVSFTTNRPSFNLNSTSSDTAFISKEELRKSYQNILGETASSFNTSHIDKPLQLSGNIDTTSPNGKLPDGDVSMDLIMGLMNKK
jgi:hypothetical protein